MALLLSLLACAQPGDPVLLLTGWNYEWEELSHRVAYLRVGIQDDSSLALGLVGGDWSTGATFSDTPYYRVRYQEVTATDLQVFRGTATLLVGPDPVGTTTLELDAPDLPAGRSLVAIVNGFSIDTGIPQGPDYPADYDPSYGYTSNGFGFTLGEVEVDGDVLRVPVEARIRWGPQDRDDVNAAIPFAVTEVTVDVAVLASPLEPESLPLTATADYTWDPPYSDQPPMEIPVAFAGGAREGFVGWRSFDLQSNLVGPDAGEGDYLRAFGAEVEPLGTDPRAFEGTATATLSTSSLSEWTDPYAAFEGELVRIGATDLVAEHRVVTGSHPTGRAITGPTAE
jgi:hypothetical protein